MKTKVIKTDPVVFNVRIRISTLMNRISSERIPELIALGLIFEDSSLLYEKYNDSSQDYSSLLRLYYKLKNDLNEIVSLDEAQVNDVLNKFNNEVFSTLPKSPLDLIQEYLQVLIQKLHNEYSEDDSFKVEISDISHRKGCWITTFNLVFTTYRNLKVVYDFVNFVARRFCDDPNFNWRKLFNIGVTATPDTKAPQTAGSSDNVSFSRYLAVSVMALTVSLIAGIFSIIGITKGINENKVRKIVKEETEQVVNKKVSEEVTKAIDHEKLEYVFDRMIVQPQKEPTKDTESNQ